MPAGHTEYDLRAASQRRSRCGRQHAVQACRTPSPPLHPAGIDQLAGDFRLTLDQQIGRAPSRRSAVTGNVNPEASTLIPTMATITCGWPRVTPMWTDVPTATCARRSTSTTGRSSTASPSLYTAPAMGTSTMVAVAYCTGQCPWHRRHPRLHEGVTSGLGRALCGGKRSTLASQFLSVRPLRHVRIATNFSAACITSGQLAKPRRRSVSEDEKRSLEKAAAGEEAGWPGLWSCWTSRRRAT